MVLSQVHAYKTALDLGLVVAYCDVFGQELMRGACTGRAARDDAADLRVRIVVEDETISYEATAETVDGEAFLDLVR
jgi:hypothetical protein